MEILNKIKLALGCAFIGVMMQAQAATFIVVNDDQPGQGLNDARPVNAVPGNSFTSLGSQRLQVITRALDDLGKKLNIDMSISVSVRFESLECDKDTAVLGGAAPKASFFGFDKAPNANILYPAPLANLHAGMDLDPNAVEIEFIFNGDIDFNDDCLAGSNLYYGLDGAEPKGSVNFYSVVLHEAIHGLGFMTYMDARGQTPDNLSDPFLENMFSLYLYKFLAQDSYTKEFATYLGPIGFLNPLTSAYAPKSSSGIRTVGQYLNTEPMRVPLLYSPVDYDPYSSLSHWDSSLEGALMTPYTGASPVTSISTFELAALTALGWPVSLPAQDRDSDGVADSLDGYPDDASRSANDRVDADNDNLPDVWEQEVGLPSFNGGQFQDADADGVPNILELLLGTHPVDSDSDDDAVIDIVEHLAGYDPLNAASCPQLECQSGIYADKLREIELDEPLHQNLKNYHNDFVGSPDEATLLRDGGVIISGRYLRTSFLLKLNADKQVDTRFGNQGRIGIKELGGFYGASFIGKAIEDSRGYLYVATVKPFSGETRPGNPPSLVFDHYIHRLLPNGTPDPAFTPYNVKESGINIEKLFYRIDSQDRLVIAWDEYQDGEQEGYSGNIKVIRLTAEGSLDSGFAQAGMHTLDEQATLLAARLYIGLNDEIYLLYIDFAESPPRPRLLRITAQGNVDTSFANQGRFTASLDHRGSVGRFNNFVLGGTGDLYYIDNVDDQLKRFSVDRITRLNQAGQQVSQHLISDHKTSVFSESGWVLHAGEWINVLDTGITDEGLNKNTLYAFHYDQNFKLLKQESIYTVAPYESADHDNETMLKGAPLLTATGDLLLVSNYYPGGSPKISLREYFSTRGWNKSLGDTGRKVVEIFDSMETALDVVVDPQGRWLIAFADYYKLDGSYYLALTRFHKDGTIDNSFGADGIFWPKVGKQKLSDISNMQFAPNGDLYFVGNVAKKMYLMRITAAALRSSSAQAFLIKELSIPEYETLIAPIEYLLLPNNEIFLTYSFGLVSYDNAKSKPTISYLHLDTSGAPLNRLIPGGRSDETFGDIRFTSGGGVTDLRYTDAGTIEYLRIVPDGAAQVNQSVMRRIDNRTGIAQDLFGVSRQLYPYGVMALNNSNNYFVYGSYCLVVEYCNSAFFQYYAVVDVSGNIVPSFNNGKPLLLFPKPGEQIAYSQAQQFGELIYIQSTNDLGSVVRTEGSFGSYADKGNAFHLLVLDVNGKVHTPEPIVKTAPDFEIYLGCIPTRQQQGVCVNVNEPFYNLRLLRWSDKTDPDFDLVDGDSDGIPDSAEDAFNLNPLNAADALTDSDGDGRNNLQEYRSGMDLLRDDVPPELVPPVDLRLAATAPYTYVALGNAKAIDIKDGAINTKINVSPYFAPGAHQVEWFAVDAAGNQRVRYQHLSVLPQLYLFKSKTVLAGVSDKLEIYASGEAPEYPVAAEITHGQLYNNGVHFYSEDIIQYMGWPEVMNGGVRTGDSSNTNQLNFSLGEIDGAVVGGNSSHQINIVRAPKLTKAVLRFVQNELPVSRIDPAGGPVRVNLDLGASVKAADVKTEWAFDTGHSITPVNQTSIAATFDPAAMPQGFYRLNLKVSLVGKSTDSVLVSEVLKVVSKPILYQTEDSDVDGISDMDEGSHDRDNDRIADYRDFDSRAYVQMTNANYWRVVYTQPGYSLRLGETAFVVDSANPIIRRSDIDNYAPLSQVKAFNKPVSGNSPLPEFVYDMEISGLQEFGQSATLIVSLNESLAQNASVILHIYSLGWRSFIENNIDQIYSAASVNNVCPSEQYVGYQKGLRVGNDCLKLILTDGGINDADQTADGVIRILTTLGGQLITGSNSSPSSSSAASIMSASSSAAIPRSSSAASVQSGGGSGGGGGMQSINLFLLLSLVLIRFLSAGKIACYNRGK